MGINQTTTTNLSKTRKTNQDGKNLALILWSIVTLNSLDLLCFFYFYPERLNYDWSQSAICSMSIYTQVVYYCWSKLSMQADCIFCEFKTTNLKRAICYNLLCYSSHLSLLLSKKIFPQTPHDPVKQKESDRNHLIFQPPNLSALLSVTLPGRKHP